MSKQFLLHLALVVLLGLSGAASMHSAQSPDSSNKNKKEYVASNTNKDEHAAAKGSAAPIGGPAAIKLPEGYRVGVDDELVISVWHEPELSQGVAVRPDGMITLPLLNDVQVVGLTSEEMQVLLTEKMKPFVNDPQVTVSVKAIKSRKVFLFGNVAKQGVYPLGGHKTVMELLAEAGGLTPFAKEKSIYVLRSENGKQVRLPFNYKKALSGKGVNPELLSGDMVVVP